MTQNDSITLSPKHGVNPTVTRCIACGKDYGVALMGLLKNDEEAPREIYSGLCNDCQNVVNNGGVLVLEVRDGESGSNPYRTGRIIGCSKEFKERNNIQHPIVYMEQTLFTKIFGNEFKKD